MNRVSAVKFAEAKNMTMALVFEHVCPSRLCKTARELAVQLESQL